MTWREELLTEREQLLLTDAEFGIEEWAGLARKLAEQLDLVTASPTTGKTAPWNRDIVNELPYNCNCPSPLQNGWWRRRWDQIDYVTIHHTLSDSPHALAEQYIHKGGGRPSIPYTIWVTQTGEVLLCNEFEEGCWHDHTGHENTHLSIGMAGTLHLYAPSDAQIDATARVCAAVVNNPDIPLVDGIAKIKGHMDWYKTACPGWLDTGEGKPSGLWKPRLYNRIEELLK